MKQIKIEKDSYVLFARNKEADNFLLRLPELICNGTAIPGINSEYVFIDTEDCILSLSTIRNFYQKHKRTTTVPSPFLVKHTVITVRSSKDDFTDLQYILALDKFFETHNSYCSIIIEISDDSMYFKLAQFLSLRNSFSRFNILVRQGKVVKELPQSNIINFKPGEILPCFAINREMYETCYRSFTYDESLLITASQSIGFDDFKQSIIDLSEIEQYLYYCIYCNFFKISSKPLLIEILSTLVEMPILSVLIFSSLLSNAQDKWDKFNLSVALENCIDYALSLEQIIENTYFYADSGTLSFRVHNYQSEKMQSILSDKYNSKTVFYLDVLLVDYCRNETIVDKFISFVDDAQKSLMQTALMAPNALDKLFNPEKHTDVSGYFENPAILIEHYGLQTIHLMAKKTNALFCLKNKNYYYASSNNALFSTPKNEDYPYELGTCYRLVIPIKSVEIQYTYTGISENDYKFSVLQQEYHHIPFDCGTITMPHGREEKNSGIMRIKRLFEEGYRPDKTNVINAFGISRRIEIEYLIKAILSLLNDHQNSNPVYFAIIGIRNKSLIKLALRLIALCYTTRGINELFKENELFLCTAACDVEVLISGEKYSDIIENLTKQQIFGALDDEIFNELSASVSVLER